MFLKELPSEIILNIFSRLPVKSLARSKCVSKEWCEAIEDPHLAILHLKQCGEEKPTQFLFRLGSTDHKPPGTVSFHIIDSKEDGISLEEKREPVFEFRSQRAFPKPPVAVLLGSCHGLLTFLEDYKDVTSLIVTQPLTRECYRLPDMDLPPGSERYMPREASGLGFDNRTNTFKMVCVLLKEIVPSTHVDLVRANLCTMVHVLGTNSWHEISQIPSVPISGRSVFAKGHLYWLSSIIDSQHIPGGRKVIYFDVPKEEFGSIDTPKRKGPVNHQLVNLNGELGLACPYYPLIEVWRLKEYPKKEWVIHCRFDQKPPLPCGDIDVMGAWNKEGDILMQSLVTSREQSQFLFRKEKEEEKRKEGFFAYGSKAGLSHTVTGLQLSSPEHNHLCFGSLFSIRGINAGDYSKLIGS